VIQKKLKKIKKQFICVIVSQSMLSVSSNITILWKIVPAAIYFMYIFLLVDIHCKSFNKYHKMTVQLK